MRQPITFMHGNLVFGSAHHEAWAVYRLPTRSYAALPIAGKRQLLSQLAGLARVLEADFSLLRVARPWDIDQYELGVLTKSDVRHVRREELDAYLERERQAHGDRLSHVPEVYLSVRLDAAARSSWSWANLSPARAVRRAVGRGDGLAVSRRRLGALQAEERRACHAVRELIDAERAAAHELQWLIRRAFVRGVGDPLVDERFLPQALVLDPGTDGREPDYRPLEADVLRLFDSPINVEARKLRVESERGDSHQAFLCVGALPEVAPFPGRQAELLFAPLENLEFPVDAAFSARFVPNAESARLLRAQVVEVGDPEPGSSREDARSEPADHRPKELRELERRLLGADHRPLLRATVSFALGAPSAAELEDRVKRLRREYESVRLHRPLGEQLGLFIAHLPGQRVPLADYDDYLTPQQLGAMVPTATHAVGAESGPRIGHTLSGGRKPVLFDLQGDARRHTPPATLLTGPPDAGRSMCMKLILYQAFLAGSIICDVDPRGDHVLDLLPGMAGELEVLELSADERWRGILDPLHIAPEPWREEIAYSFLMDVLGGPVIPSWNTEIRRAIRTASDEGGCCGDVIEELRHASSDARVAARALAVRSAAGLSKLGFAVPGAQMVAAPSRQVTSLRIRGLELPPGPTAGAGASQDQRLGRAILHLMAVYGMRLARGDGCRHGVLSLDEAWVLLSDPRGRALLDRISQPGDGHAHDLSPLLITRLLGDVAEFEGQIGAVFCFGAEDEREIRAALRLLHLNESGPTEAEQFLHLGYGRCLMRDYGGRVSPIQVDVADPQLRAALDGATPRAGSRPRKGAEKPDAGLSRHEVEPLRE